MGSTVDDAPSRLVNGQRRRRLGRSGARPARLGPVARRPLLDEEHFEQRYATSGGSGPLAVEREVLGSDYRATGYTTLDQADELGRLLDLNADSVLLDIGAGCGWPGLYLAARYCCSVVTTDTVAEGSMASLERIRADRLRSRALPLVAVGEHVPIRAGSIDAVVHADVLC